MNSSGQVGHATPRNTPLVIGPVQEEVGVANVALDTLAVQLQGLIEKLEPVLGCATPTDSACAGGSLSHCDLHARLMGVTERITTFSNVVCDISQRIKL